MLEIRNIHKVYRTGTLVQKALDGVSLALRDSEFVAVLGPSGSGKTTLLNVIGGLDRYDSGEMLIEGIPTSRYNERDWDTYRNHTIGFIFQNYNLIPHQTILRNVELALTLTGVNRYERRMRAEDALESVGLLEQAHKKPAQLSGGQMQRVAIARALVNDPAVVLADEPTGALDSETGEQVMELLREVAKDRLVVMVTHNPELAERYATRTVRVRDGRIIEDSDPFDPEAEESRKKSETEKMPRRWKKPSMKPKTALSLSVSNLLSKKARTLLVAFASSIGIIGIALILSLSYGANAYIRKMEEASLSQYPLEISNSSFSMESMMASFAGMASGRTESGGEGIGETQLLGGMFSGVGTNDLAALKRWLEGGYSGMEELTRGIEYRYGLSPQIYLKEADGYRQVNPDQTMTAMGLSTSENLSGMMASYSMNDVFKPLPENSALYMDSYELRAGHWPEKDTDCVLVLTSEGHVMDFLLYTMGLKDVNTLNEMIDGVMTGNGADTALGESARYRPEDFLGICFRVLPAASAYIYDEKLGVWVDRSGDTKAMTELLDKAEEMTITGVVQPAGGSSMSLLRIGIDYPAGLMKRLMSEASETEIVKQQLAELGIDVLTGLPFGQRDDSVLSLFTDAITVHPENLGEAVSFDWDGLASLQSEETKMTWRKAVRIAREYQRTGESPTLRAMLENLIPLLMNLVEIDQKAISRVISLDMDENHLQEMFAARAAAAQATSQGNLLKFGYADPDVPSAVTIYPGSYEDKEKVIALLDAYNAAMKDAGYEEKVIRYTDYVGSLMSTVTVIIDVISYILIAFVAISLIVSSIMIGIITYISVLERRKEIGILRALGASRRNITQVFNAETLIIGLLAGGLGVGLTMLLILPINMMIASLTDQPVRAQLPAGSAGILVALCVVLTLIGGLIPARGAARQDPVNALRSE